MGSQQVALTIFLFSYLLFVFLPAQRTLVAALGALALVIVGSLTPQAAFAAVNWNVMGIFVGTLFLADVFMKSRVPARFAEIIVNRSRSSGWAILFICLMTGFISAFVENVATVLIVAPIALALAKKIQLNPVKMLIAIAVSSNLQGTATLIGDPPSMLLGGFAGMNFGDFFFYHGRPSIFFAVELGALVSFFVLYFIFHRHRHKAEVICEERVASWVPSILLLSLIILLAGSSFISTGFTDLSGLICLIFGLVSILWNWLANRSSVFDDLKGLDWDTTFFLIAVFVLVGGLTANGWIETFAAMISGLVGQNVFLAYTLIVFSSVILSAFVDNVPFLAAMLPVAVKVAGTLNVNPSLFLFGLLIGASLGGNITPIGASANIVACGLLKKEGHRVSFGDFVKIGLPFTIAAVVPAYLFIWLVWAR